MNELKKLERYLRVNLLGLGPRLMKKEITGPRSHNRWGKNWPRTRTEPPFPRQGIWITACEFFHHEPPLSLVTRMRSNSTLPAYYELWSMPALLVLTHMINAHALWSMLTQICAHAFVVMERLRPFGPYSEKYGGVL